MGPGRRAETRMPPRGSSGASAGGRGVRAGVEAAGAAPQAAGSGPRRSGPEWSDNDRLLLRRDPHPLATSQWSRYRRRATLPRCLQSSISAVAVAAGPARAPEDLGARPPARLGPARAGRGSRSGGGGGGRGRRARPRASGVTRLTRPFARPALLLRAHAPPGLPTGSGADQLVQGARGLCARGRARGAIVRTLSPRARGGPRACGVPGTGDETDPFDSGPLARLS